MSTVAGRPNSCCWDAPVTCDVCGMDFMLQRAADWSDEEWFVECHNFTCDFCRGGPDPCCSPLRGWSGPAEGTLAV